LLAAVWRLRLAVGATCYAVVAIWSIVGVADRAERGVLIAAGGLLFQPGLAVADLWLQANLRARTATIAQMLALTAGAGARVALILADAPLWTFGAAAAAEAGVAAAILTVLARRIGLRIAAERDSWALLRPLLRDAWPLLLSSASIAIYMRIDVVMLRNLAGDGAVGIYTAAVRLSEMSYFLPIAMGASLLPSLLRARAAGEAAYAERMQQYFDLSAGLAYAVALPLAVASPWVVQLAYGAQFAAAAPVLALHVWATLFVFLGVARGQFLVNESLTFFYLLATAAGAVVNIALNALLIPRIGAIGTALATVTSYATAAWLSSYLHPAVRSTAVRQTRALLLPLTGWRYLRRS
jgi:O-antigen/teichoic acid export membrane protein